MNFQRRFVFSVLLAGLETLFGCESNQKPELTPSQQQDAILEKMDWKPTVGRPITSGDITTFDGDGFMKDFHHALEP